MKYKLERENRPTLKNYGRYRAVAIHPQTVTSRQVEREIEANCSLKVADVRAVLAELSDVLVRHLQAGDRVRLDDLGLLKLEIESEKVDSPDDFRPQRDIRGVRLHLLPESYNGHQRLYQDITFERWEG